jgi:hypothetical protein
VGLTAQGLMALSTFLPFPGMVACADSRAGLHVHFNGMCLLCNTPISHGSQHLSSGRAARYKALAVQELLPLLPPPLTDMCHAARASGDKAAALLGTLLGAVDKVITNHDRVHQLRDRAVAFIKILALSSDTLQQVRAHAQAAGGGPHAPASHVLTVADITVGGR